VAECVEFAGAKDDRGYGRKRRGSKVYLAHRLAYVDANGLEIEDIDGEVIRHSCDNPPCIEPQHLIRGTTADNIADKIARGRHQHQKKAGCPKCGGPYKTKPSGGRYCSPCEVARQRTRREEVAA
jgi:hypothetical protein